MILWPGDLFLSLQCDCANRFMSTPLPLIHTCISMPPLSATTCSRSPLSAAKRHWAPLEPSGYRAPSSTSSGLDPTKPGPVLKTTTADAKSTSRRACSNLRKLTGNMGEKTKVKKKKMPRKHRSTTEQREVSVWVGSLSTEKSGSRGNRSTEKRQRNSWKELTASSELIWRQKKGVSTKYTVSV